MSTPSNMVTETFGVFLEFRGVDPLKHIDEIRAIASVIPGSWLISDEERKFVAELFENAHATMFSGSVTFWVQKSITEAESTRMGELASEIASLSLARQFALSVGNVLCIRALGGTEKTATHAIQNIAGGAHRGGTTALDPEDDRIEVVIGAATQHAEGTGEFDHEVGDLQDVLRAAWGLMSNEQRQALLTCSEAKTVLEAGDENPNKFERAPAAAAPSTDDLLRACLCVEANPADQPGVTTLVAGEDPKRLAVELEIPAENVPSFAKLGLAMYSMTTSIHSPDIDFEEQLRCVPSIWQNCADERDTLAAKVKHLSGRERDGGEAESASAESAPQP